MAITIDGFIVITVGGKEYTLSGDMAKGGINIQFHQPLALENALGTLSEIYDSIIGEVAGVISVPPSTFPDWATIQSDLSGIGFVESLVEEFGKASLIITDLVVNTVTSTYQFGFGVLFDPTDQPHFAGIAMDGFGMKVTKTAQQTSSSTG